MLNLLKEYKNKGYELYLATDQEDMRINYIFNTLELNKIFSGFFHSGGVGYKKREDGFWECLKRELKDVCHINEMILIDDTKKNVEMAKKHGVDGYIYKGFERAEKELSSGLIKTQEIKWKIEIS